MIDKVYKIRNKKTGQFSVGGTYWIQKVWTKKGKIWTDLGHIKTHMQLDHNKEYFEDSEIVEYSIVENGIIGL